MINLPPVRPRASYAGVDKDSLAYAVVLNPAAQADPIDTYQTRTKANYDARAGQAIAGNLGRNEAGQFARIDEAVARSASLHGGKKPKKATRSAAQVAAAKRETAHATLQAAKIDKAVYDGVTALDDAPVKAGEESDAVKELVKAGYAEEAGGMIVPSALGSRLAKAAESGKPGKVAQVVARESQRTQQRTERTRARAQALDDKIAAAEDYVKSARNDRQRAIAQRRLDAAKTQRAALGDVGKSTLKHMPGKHNQSSHGHRGAVGGAFRAAYTAARAGGKTHSEAWNAGKHAAEGVREQMRVEKRAQAAANPKPKRTTQPEAPAPKTPPRVETTNRTAESDSTAIALRNRLNNAREVELLARRRLDKANAENASGLEKQAAQREYDSASARVRQLEDAVKQATTPTTQPEAAAPAEAPAPAPAPRSLFSNLTPRAPKPVIPGDTSTYPEDLQRRITGTTTRYNDQQARIAAAPRDRATKELAQKYLDEWRMSSDSGTYELAREAADPTLSSNRKRQRQLNELRKNQVELLEFHELLLRGQKFAPAQVQTMQRILDRNAAIRKELAKEGDYRQPTSGDNPKPARPKQPAQPSAPRAAKPKVDTTPYVTSTPKTGNEETDKYLAARDRTHAILQSGVNPKTGKKLKPTERDNLRYRLDLIEQRTGITDPVLERERSMIGDFSTTSFQIGQPRTKAVLSSAQRRKLPGSSFVFPDTRSFPITDKRDIQKAVHAWGRYQGQYSFEVFKRRLTAIARRMGAVDALPDTWQVKTKAADHDMTPPQDVRDAAKRGLALRRQFGRGGTEVGIARARDLSNGASIPLVTINRMVSFFARHAVDKRPDWSNPSNPSNGYIAWLLWGGDAGRRWALAMQKRMTKE